MSAILVASSTAFTIVKFCGACYLVYLGARMLLESSKRNLSEPRVSPASGGVIFWQAVITNVLNPKVAVFFLAFLPQFVPSTTDQTFLPFLFLGLVFILNGTIYCTLLVLFASVLMSKFKASERATAWLHKVTGETAVAAVRIGTYARYVIVQQRSRMTVVQTQAGVLRPICTSATGLALLSKLDDNAIRRTVARAQSIP